MALSPNWRHLHRSPIAALAATLSFATLLAGQDAALPKSVPRLELESGVFAASDSLDPLANSMASQAGVPRRLRIVSFNVHLGEDVESISESLTVAGALEDIDILLIQEIEHFPEEVVSRTEALAELLRMNFVYAPARVQERDGRIGTHGVAVLSRHPLREAVILPLPEYDLPFGKRRRIALGLTVDPPGGRVRIYNVHLDTRINLSQRIRQVSPVLEAAKKWEGVPVVIGGDFNTNPFRWAGSVVPWFRSNQAGGMDRHMKKAGYENPLSDAGTTSNRRIVSLRLDALYVRGVTVEDAAVERKVKSSDHFPVRVDLKWPPPS